jgi:hypothetical protein
MSKISNILAQILLGDCYRLERGQTGSGTPYARATVLGRTDWISVDPSLGGSLVATKPATLGGRGPSPSGMR